MKKETVCVEAACVRETHTDAAAGVTELTNGVAAVCEEGTGRLIVLVRAGLFVTGIFRADLLWA